MDPTCDPSKALYSCFNVVVVNEQRRQRMKRKRKTPCPHHQHHQHQHPHSTHYFDHYSWHKVGRSKMTQLGRIGSGPMDEPSLPPNNTTPSLSYRCSAFGSGPSGPILICVETSGSMSAFGNSGSREQFIVQGCGFWQVSDKYNKQHRECQMVSFSTSRPVIESRISTPTGERINER